MKLNILDEMKKGKYEQIVFSYDPVTGLKTITVIHNSVLGPTNGGTRLYNYKTEDEALIDCMRLARGMTHKNAAAGLQHGGCKQVIIADPKTCKSEQFFRAYGKIIQGFGGRVFTGEDMHISSQDCEWMALECDYINGLEGKSGNTSPITGYGVFRGLQACLKEKFGTKDPSKFKYAIHGVGAVGSAFLHYLVKNGGTPEKIVFTDVNQAAIERIKREYPGIKYVKPDDIWKQNVDVICPFAMGAVLNDKTIPQIKAKIVAGSANNQLADEVKHGDMLMKKGILYAPDFIINGAGVINVSHEIIGYSKEAALRDVEKIYQRLLDVFEIAKKKKINNQLAAIYYAEKRIKEIAAINGKNIKNVKCYHYAKW